MNPADLCICANIASAVTAIATTADTSDNAAPAVTSTAEPAGALADAMSALEEKEYFADNLDWGEDEPVQIDETIDAKFEIIRELGTGADSTVFLAEHLLLQKPVSLKIFKILKHDANRFARIQQEAIALANIDHPNIVGVTDLGTTANGTPYLVQQYIEGKDLHSLISEEGVLDQARALKLFGQIARGISCLHSYGIIHRDIKSSNIIVTTDDDGVEIAKLIDLGIAKSNHPGGALTFYTTKGSILGSPFYMSPEQCDSEEIDSRTDIYSFGCVMYEALTGAPPFRGETLLVTLDKHVKEIPAPINSKRRDAELISAPLEAIIMKCLAKKPQDRYATADCVIEALAILEPKRTNFARFALVSSLVVFTTIVFLIMTVRAFTSSPVETSLRGQMQKQKSETLVYDKLLTALNLDATSTHVQTIQNYEDALQEAEKHNATIPVKLQIVAQLARFYAFTKQEKEVRGLFDDWKKKLAAVDKKFDESPKSLSYGSVSSLASFYYSAGNAFFDQSLYKAEELYKQSLKYAAQLQLRNPELETLIIEETKVKLAIIYLNTSRPKQCQQYIEEVLPNLVKKDASSQQLIVCYGNLAKAAIKQQNFEQARTSLDKLKEIRDGINAPERKRRLSAEIDLLEKEVINK